MSSFKPALPYDDAEILDNAYRTNGTRKPIFIAIDETGNVYTKDHFSIYGKFKSNFEIAHVVYQTFGTELVVKEVL